MQLVGRLKSAGQLKLGGGFGWPAEAERPVRQDRMVSRNISGCVFEFVQRLRRQGVGRIL